MFQTLFVNNIRIAEFVKDKKLFDQTRCYPNLYNSAESNAVRPVLLEPILMSIGFEHYKQLTKLQKNVINKNSSRSDKCFTKR
jgi:hypothetical protein